MKLIQRTILGIIRNPLKSLIMFFVILVLSSVLSGAMILYNTTQSVIENINKQIVPVALFETPLDPIITINDLNNKIDSDDEYRVFLSQISAYEEISKLEEVNYADFGMSNGTLFMDRQYMCGDYVDMPSEFNRVDSVCRSVEEVTINNSNFALLKNKNIELTEGRLFTNEEIETGTLVALVPNNSYFMDDDGNFDYLQIGDKISLSYHILSEDVELTEELYENIHKYNEIYSTKLFDEIQFEIEIIGKYKKLGSYNFNGLKNHLTNLIIPQKLITSKFIEYHNQLIQLEYEGVIQKYDQAGVRFNDLESTNLYSYIELRSSDDIESFVEKVNIIFKEYNLSNYKLNLSNDSYLKVVGPLEGINEVSKMIVLASFVLGIFIIGIVSVIIVKDRKQEIGILLSLGENKNRVMTQLIFEILVIGMLALSMTPIISKQFSNMISGNVLANYNTNIELNDSDKVLLGDISSETVLEEYETELEMEDTFMLNAACAFVLVLACSGSVLLVLKMNPKEILM